MTPSTPIRRIRLKPKPSFFSQAIYVQVPVGVPTGDGGLEIPQRVFLGGIATEVNKFFSFFFLKRFKSLDFITAAFTEG